MQRPAKDKGGCIRAHPSRKCLCISMPVWGQHSAPADTAKLGCREPMPEVLGAWEASSSPSSSMKSCMMLPACSNRHQFVIIVEQPPAL